MLTIIEELGPATWLKDGPRLSYNEYIADEYVQEYDDGDCVFKGKDELNKMIDHLRETGKNFFKNKSFSIARNLFTKAYLISLLVPYYPKGKASILNSNAAICCMKLDSFGEAHGFLKRAITLDGNNVKAIYHMIALHYKEYRFKEALSFIEKFPNIVELRTIKERILKNDIPERFPDEIIRERNIEFLIEPPVRSLIVIFKEAKALMVYYEDNRKQDFIENAKKVLKKMNRSARCAVDMRSYEEAQQLLVDMYYIIHALQDKYHTKTNEERLFQLFKDRATCLYYMENYGEALKSCIRANQYHLNAFNVLTLEAKILSRLNRFEEATEKINKCYEGQILRPVEKLICEEILFENKFQKEAHETSLRQKRDKTSTAKRSASSSGIVGGAKDQSTDEMKAGTSSPNKGMVEFMQNYLQEKERQHNLGLMSGEEHLIGACRSYGDEVFDSWMEHLKVELFSKLIKDQQ